MKKLDVLEADGVGMLPSATPKRFNGVAPILGCKKRTETNFPFKSK